MAPLALTLPPAAAFQIVSLLALGGNSPLSEPLQKTASGTTSFATLINQGATTDNAAVREFVRRAGGTPIIEGDEAIFLVETPDLSVPRIIGDIESSPSTKTRFTRVGQSHFFFDRVRLPPAARVEYRIKVGDIEGLDPLNPRSVAAFEGRNSEVRMPGYSDPTEIATPPPAALGHVASFDHTSDSAKNSRRVHIYLPHGYEAEPERRYPVVWFNDGTDYVEQVGVIRLLDGLIAHGRVEPLIALFVDPVSRGTEYAGDAAFRGVITEELVPMIDQRYRTDARAARRMIAGGSRGGMAAIDLALAKPDIFGICGAWAPAISPRAVAEFLDGRKSGGRFALIRTLYDERFGPDAPALRDGLRSAGAAVNYSEVPEGHTLGAWPARVVEVLTTLLPAK